MIEWRMRTEDVIRRRLADGGLQALFADLHESVSLDGDRLSVVDPVEWSGELTSTGLTLVPHAIGRTRATILMALAEPATKTSLAGRPGLTPGGVSQHLSILIASELVARIRVAGTVLYSRTARGDALVG